jgi:hypothetical protein
MFPVSSAYPRLSSGCSKSPESAATTSRAPHGCAMDVLLLDSLIRATQVERTVDARQRHHPERAATSFIH